MQHRCLEYYPVILFLGHMYTCLSAFLAVLLFIWVLFRSSRSSSSSHVLAFCWSSFVVLLLFLICRNTVSFVFYSIGACYLVWLVFVNVFRTRYIRIFVGKAPINSRRFLVFPFSVCITTPNNCVPGISRRMQIGTDTGGWSH